jgi:hypothetical protein
MIAATTNTVDAVATMSVICSSFSTRRHISPRIARGSLG